MEGSKAQDPTNAEFDTDMAMYKDERRTLNEGQIQAHRDSDRWVLGVSGGALALSMTFLSDIVVPSEMQAKYLLFLSWFALAVSIGSTVTSLHCSAKSWEQHRIALDEGFSEYSNDVWERVRKLQENSKWNKIIEMLNWLSLVSLLLGLLLSGMFLASNLV